MQTQLELPRPRLLRADTCAGSLARGHYIQVYGLSGPPGAVLLQQVTTEITLSRGTQALVAYRGDYLEYFQLDEGGEALDDEHDVSLRRDGWDRAAVRRLLHRHGLRAGSGQESQLRYSKTFRLGVGSVEDAAVHVSREGRSFGFLAEGPRPIKAVIEVASIDGSGFRSLVPSSPCPQGYTPSGSGRFVSAQGWVAHEVFSYRYTTRTGTFDDEGGYRPLDLSSCNELEWSNS